MHVRLRETRRVRVLSDIFTCFYHGICLDDLWRERESSKLACRLVKVGMCVSCCRILHKCIEQTCRGRASMVDSVYRATETIDVTPIVLSRAKGTWDVAWPSIFPLQKKHRKKKRIISTRTPKPEFEHCSFHCYSPRRTLPSRLCSTTMQALWNARENQRRRKYVRFPDSFQ